MERAKNELIDDLRKRLVRVIDSARQDYLRNYVEDPIDGSTLDCSILEAFNAVEMKVMESFEKVKRVI